jgi:hypothetical protein
VQATDVSKLCCRIEHLVLVGLVDAAPFLEVGISTDGSRHDQPPHDIPKATGSRRYAVRGSQKSNRNLALLSKALRNISISGNTKYRLPRLSLETEINLRGTQRYRRHDLRFWGSNNFHRLELEHDDVAARSFHFVMEALAMSRLTIEKLAIYYTNERLGLYEVNGPVQHRAHRNRSSISRSKSLPRIHNVTVHQLMPAAAIEELPGRPVQRSRAPLIARNKSCSKRAYR